MKERGEERKKNEKSNWEEGTDTSNEGKKKRIKGRK